MNFKVNYDIAVVGGGIAGIAAAIQAARSGKKTVLVEKTILPGGLATSGLVYIYLPICDGNGHQVTFGLSEELLKASIQYGPGEIPANWRNAENAEEQKRYRCVFSPAAFMLALEEALRNAGVDIWYDTLLCDAAVEDGRLAAAVVENESGRGEIRAKQFIDASGSSVLARRAGVPCLDGDNFYSLWALEYRKGAHAGHRMDELGESVVMHFDGAWANGDSAVSEERLAKCGFTRESLKEKTVRHPSGKDVSDYILATRHFLLEYYRDLHASGQFDRRSCYALKLPAMPQFRKISCIQGEYVLKDNEHATRFEDSIGLLADWRKPGFVWEIPYRTLYPANRLGGLLAAGRCTSATGDAWEITRVIPSAAMTGQVAGLAAALAIDEGREPGDLSVPLLQQKLRKLGFALHLPDVGL